MIQHDFDRGGISSNDSSSKSINETVNGSHNFTIRGYSLTKGVGPGKYISSDVFTVGGYDWAIYFYPDGKNVEDESSYVSVFVALVSEGVDVRALFELTLLDQSDKGRNKVHSHFDRALETGPYTLKCRGSMWGYKKFFRRTTLEASDYLKDDCLSMNCTVGVVRTRVEGPKPYTINIPSSDMGHSLETLLDSEIGCDIELQVKDETFKAHRLILAARSPVFKAQFFGLIGNPDAEKVELDEIEPSIFKAMLRFIYSDSFPDLHKITGATSVCTITILTQQLLAAADRFGLDRLKKLCEAKLCEAVTTDTVATTLSLAEQHHCPQLKSICLKLAAVNLGVVLRWQGFKHLGESRPALLSKLLETIVSEDENSSSTLSRKRSGSSIFMQDLAAAVPAESVNPNNRRFRRRV